MANGNGDYIRNGVLALLDEYEMRERATEEVIQQIVTMLKNDTIPTFDHMVAMLGSYPDSQSTDRMQSSTCYSDTKNVWGKDHSLEIKPFSNVAEAMEGQETKPVSIVDELPKNNEIQTVMINDESYSIQPNSIKDESIEKYEINPISIKDESIENREIQPISIKVDYKENYEINPISRKDESIDDHEIHPISIKDESIENREIQPISIKVDYKDNYEINPISMKDESIDNHEIYPISSNNESIENHEIIQPILSNDESIENHEIQPISSNDETIENHEIIQPILSNDESIENHEIQPISSNDESIENHEIIQPILSNDESIENHEIHPISSNNESIESHEIQQSHEIQPILSNDESIENHEIQPISSNDESIENHEIIQPILSNDESIENHEIHPISSNNESIESHEIRHSHEIQPILSNDESIENHEIQPILSNNESIENHEIQPISRNDDSIEKREIANCGIQPILRHDDSIEKHEIANCGIQPISCNDDSIEKHEIANCGIQPISRNDDSIEKHEIANCGIQPISRNDDSIEKHEIANCGIQPISRNDDSIEKHEIANCGIQPISHNDDSIEEHEIANCGIQPISRNDDSIEKHEIANCGIQPLSIKGGSMEDREIKPITCLGESTDVCQIKPFNNNIRMESVQIFSECRNRNDIKYSQCVSKSTASPQMKLLMNNDRIQLNSSSSLDEVNSFCKSIDSHEMICISNEGDFTDNHHLDVGNSNEDRKDGHMANIAPLPVRESESIVMDNTNSNDFHIELAQATVVHMTGETINTIVPVKHHTVCLEENKPSFVKTDNVNHSNSTCEVDTMRLLNVDREQFTYVVGRMDIAKVNQSITDDSTSENLSHTSLDMGLTNECKHKNQFPISTTSDNKSTGMIEECDVQNEDHTPEDPVSSKVSNLLRDLWIYGCNENGQTDSTKICSKVCLKRSRGGHFIPSHDNSHSDSEHEGHDKMTNISDSMSSDSNSFNQKTKINYKNENITYRKMKHIDCLTDDAKWPPLDSNSLGVKHGSGLSQNDDKVDTVGRGRKLSHIHKRHFRPRKRVNYGEDKDGEIENKTGSVGADVDKKYKSSICGKQLYCNSGLNQHEKKFHDSKSPNNTMCDNEQSNGSDTDKSSGVNEQSFKDDSLAGNMTNTMTHSGQFVMECLADNDEKGHLSNNEKRHVCPICNAQVYSKYSLNRHIKTQHEQKQKPQQCTICSRVIGRPGNFERHITKHRLKQESSAGDQKKKRTKDKRHLCSICGRLFSSKHNLQRHIRTQHEAPKDRSKSKPKLECPYCGLVYKFRYNFEPHIKAHRLQLQCKSGDPSVGQEDENQHEVQEDDGKEERNYKCLVCNKAFPTPETLKSHKICHRLKKVYLCQTCGKSYTNPIVYYRHSKIHTGDKKHQCKVCGFRFIQKCTLQRHVKTQHPSTAVDS